MRESIRIVFIIGCISTGFCCSCTKDIAGPVPTFHNPHKPGVSALEWLFDGKKKPGIRYRKPRLLLRILVEVTVLLWPGNA
jgi:hypothetical protein